MKVVKYKHTKKGGMHVHWPIGAKTKSQVKKVLTFDPQLELEDADADKLVALDPYNFEIVVPQTQEKPGKKHVEAKEEAAHEPVLEVAKAHVPKKRTTKKVNVA